MLRLAPYLVSTALIGLAGASTGHADEQSAWRLFVADHSQPVLTALDAETGDFLDRFDLKSPATVYSSQSGRTVFAVQRDGNAVSAFSSGIDVDDHGDHGDIEVSAPERLGSDIAGDRPVHFVDHDGRIALFFDGEGVARIIDEASLGGEPAIREIATAAPHHGVALAWGDYAIVSEPDPADPSELPVGVRIVDASGAAGALHACPGLHGEAGSGNSVAIACETGLLIVTPGGDGPSITHLDYAESLPDDTKVSTLAGGRGLQYFLGNFGPDAIVLIDPQDAEPFRLIDLPTRRVHFAVDPVRSKYAYVFTEDGQLHRIDVLAGAIDGSIRLTDPYSMDGHWSDPRPRIAVTADAIAVTDPLASTIHMVDPERFEKAREIEVEGKPFNIVAVGGSGTVHD